MTTRALRNPIRWTEDELRQDIARIESLLANGNGRSAHARCARAYLQQVLKDRKSTLKILRVRDAERRPEPPRAEPTLSWPTPPSRPEFRPLLRV